jgi:hypothetical protein
MMHLQIQNASPLSHGRAPRAVGALVLFGALLLTAAACGSSDTTAPTEEQGTPTGWAVTSSQDAEIGMENLTVHTGDFAGYMHGSSGTSFASLTQAFLGSSLQGKRVRVTAWVNDSFLSQAAVVQVQMYWPDTLATSQVDIERPTGGTDHWHPVSVVMDAPPTLAGINIALMLRGSGQFFFDDVTVEAVDTSTPLSLVSTSKLGAVTDQQQQAFFTDKPPLFTNGGFEEGLSLTAHM